MDRGRPARCGPEARGPKGLHTRAQREEVNATAPNGSNKGAEAPLRRVEITGAGEIGSGLLGRADRSWRGRRTWRQRPARFPPATGSAHRRSAAAFDASE